MADYLDTSAFLKLVLVEPESGALRAELTGAGEFVSSALLLVEGRRAAARHGSEALARAHASLTAVTLLPLDDAALLAAAELEPPELRSLHALHLAAAISLGSEIGRFLCYDARLCAAAEAHGLDVCSPA